MPNTFLKAEKIAATSIGLLERELILPRLVWRNADSDFVGAGGDTISIPVPARTTARKRALRAARPTASEGNGIITMDELTEFKIPMTLTDDVYNAIPITDEELTLDIRDFGRQVLTPQVRAVGEGLEDAVAAEMLGATYLADNIVEVTTANGSFYKALLRARRRLNSARVPMSERFVVVGAAMEEVALSDDRLSKYNEAGDNTALRDASIGRLAGFGDIYTSSAIPDDVGFVFHRAAFALALRAPAVPDGASYGSSQNYQGLAMRWIRDYDFRNVQDRSLVGTFIGTNTVADGGADHDELVRAVKLELA